MKWEKVEPQGSGDRETTALAGQVAVITGGTGEIGRAIAVGLARHGVDIALTHRDPRAIETVVRDVEQFGVRCCAIHADMSKRGDVLKVIPTAVAVLGRIDVLINQAGTVSSGSLLDQSDDEWDDAIAVNLTAPFMLARDAARQMVAQGLGGRIINIGSSSAFRASHAPVAYASAKAGLGGLTRSAAGTLGPHGINVNEVVPGATETAGMRRVHPDQHDRDRLVREGPMANLLERISTPEDIAAVVVFLCTSGSRQITGQTVHVSAGAVL